MGDTRHLVMCWEKKHQFYFLPGGTLEPGENLRTCLVRELQEEMGIDVQAGPFVGCIENHWQGYDYIFQEFIFIFRAQAPPNLLEGPIVAQESHIAFEMVALQDLPNLPVMPTKLNSFIEQYYTKTSAYLWESQLS